MTLTAIIVMWLALNYAIMARLSYVGMRRDGSAPQAAFRRSLVWPVALLQPRRV